MLYAGIAAKMNATAELKVDGEPAKSETTRVTAARAACALLQHTPLRDAAAANRAFFTVVSFATSNLAHHSQYKLEPAQEPFSSALSGLSSARNDAPNVQ